jgi:hypothetical protein
MGVPNFLLVRFLVAEEEGSGRGQWGAVEVEGAVELGVGGEFGVDSRASHKFEGDVGLWNEAAPQVHWKVGVAAAEDGDEVVLGSADRSLGGVAAVIPSVGVP